MYGQYTRSQGGDPHHAPVRDFSTTAITLQQYQYPRGELYHVGLPLNTCSNIILSQDLYGAGQRETQEMVALKNVVGKRVQSEVWERATLRSRCRGVRVRVWVWSQGMSICMGCVRRPVWTPYCHSRLQERDNEKMTATAGDQVRTTRGSHTHALVRQRGSPYLPPLLSPHFLHSLLGALEVEVRGRGGGARSRRRCAVEVDAAAMLQVSAGAGGGGGGWKVTFRGLGRLGAEFVISRLQNYEWR